jgi:membrane protease YdiL (CAAX protease family)
MSTPAAPRGRLLGWLAFVGVLAASAYLLRLGEGEPDPNIVYEYSLFVASVVQYGLMLGIVLWIAKGLPKRELFAFRRPVTGFWATVGWTALTLVAIFVVAAALEPFLEAGEEQGLTPDEWDPDRAGAFAASFVSIAVIAPIVEEIVYRGEGFALLERYGTAVAVGVTGVAFGLAHGLIVGLPILVVFGLGQGLLRAKTKSIYPPIALHSLFNAAALIVSVTVDT